MFGAAPNSSLFRFQDTPDTQSAAKVSKTDAETYNWLYSRSSPLPHAPKEASTPSNRDPNGIRLFPSTSTQGFFFGPPGFSTKGNIPSSLIQTPADILNPTSIIKHVSAGPHFKPEAENSSYDITHLSYGNFSSFAPVYTFVSSVTQLPTGEILALVDNPGQVLIMLAPGIWSRFAGIVPGDASSSPATTFSLTPTPDHPLRSTVSAYSSMTVSHDQLYILDYSKGTNQIVTTSGELHSPVISFRGGFGTCMRYVFPSSEKDTIFLSEGPSSLQSVTFTASIPTFGVNSNEALKPVLQAITAPLVILSYPFGLTSRIFKFAFSSTGICVTILDKVMIHRGSAFLKEFDAGLLPSNILCIAFTQNGDLVILSYLSNSKRQLSIVAFKELLSAPPLNSTSSPLPLLWSFEFGCTPRGERPAGSFPAGFSPDLSGIDFVETVAASSDGHLLVASGKDVLYIAPKSSHSTSKGFQGMANAKKPLNFEFLRTLPSNSLLAAETFHNELCNFTVPLSLSLIQMRCPKLLKDKDSLQTAQVFSHDAFVALFMFVYDNQFWEPPHDSAEDYLSPARVRFYVELVVLASSLELDSFCQYVQFRLFKVVEADKKLLSPILLLSAFELKQYSSIPLLKRASELVTSVPKEKLPELFDHMVDSLASTNPELLKVVIRSALVGESQPPFIAYSNPFPQLASQLEDLFQNTVLEVPSSGSQGEKASLLPKTDYILCGVPCHRDILASRWKYYREHILPSHPSTFDIGSSSEQQTDSATLLLKFIYTDKIDHLNASSLRHLIDSELFKFTNDDPTFDYFRSTCFQNSASSSSSIFKSYQQNLALATQPDALYRSRLLVAEHLATIIKNHAEEFAALPPTEQYAIFMIEFEMRMKKSQTVADTTA